MATKKTAKKSTAKKTAAKKEDAPVKSDRSIAEEEWQAQKEADLAAEQEEHVRRMNTKSPGESA